MNFYRGRQVQILLLFYSLVMTMLFEIEEQSYFPNPQTHA